MSARFVLPDKWKAVRLVLIRPSEWLHASAVAEVMEALVFGFRAIGVTADTGENQILNGAVNIFFMSHVLGAAAAAQLPPNSIIYNFEQVGGGTNLLTAAFRTAIARCRVWDYSVRNMTRLEPIIGHDRRQVVPIGYVPSLSRIHPAALQDIDVLFYGAVNERRRDILIELQKAGLRVHAPFGVYGAERDALIARAKVVLNIHAHTSKVLEVVRISYLVANRKAVITELDAETEVEPDIRDAVAGVPYDRLVAECRRLVADAGERQDLEDRGYAIFQRRDLVPILRQAISEAQQTDDGNEHRQAHHRLAGGNRNSPPNTVF
ncbi:MAG: hypothetical protein ACLPZ0_11905 [Steroidobacteraceae bacterium]